MSNWDKLQKSISGLQDEAIMWHRDIPDSLRDEWTNHGVAVFQLLTTLLALPNISDEEKENRLRRYLTLRWQLTQRTSVDYTLHPQFPANKACLLIAEAIAKSDELVVQILMPTVTAVIGVADTAMSVKDVSENSEGRFAPSHFLINTAATAVIALQDFFEYVELDTDRAFSDNPFFSLTAEDQKNICSISPEAKDLFVTLAAIHRVKNNEKKSIGYLLRYLQKTLLKSSRSRSGNELNADFSECEAPILATYQYWRLLEETHSDIYAKINQYRASRDEDHDLATLKNYLLAMFSTIAGVALTDDEIKIVTVLKRKISFCCAEQMANALEAIITNNPDLEKIPLPGHEEHFDSVEILPDAASLMNLHNAFIDKLDQRTPMLGCDGELACRLPLFNAFSAHLCKEEFSVNDFLFCNSVDILKMLRLVDIPQILWMLPQEIWHDFFKINNRYITIQLAQEMDALHLIVMWMQKIPMAGWNVFFESVGSVGALRTHIAADTISYFFEHCPESQWSLLHKAMTPFFSAVFFSIDHLKVFFTILEVSLHFEAISALFSAEIKKCFEQESPESPLVDLFIGYKKTQWYMLAAALKDIISDKITSLKQVVFMLGRIADFPDRVKFLKYVMRYSPALKIDPCSIYTLLQIVDEKEWWTVLHLIDSTRLKTIIYDHITLGAFLSMFFNLQQRLVLLDALSQNIFLHQKISSSEFYQLFNKFSECGEFLILLYRHQLPDMFNELLTTFKILKEYRTEIPKFTLEVFYFLIEKTLPHVFKSTYVFSFFPSLDSKDISDAARQLMLDFGTIEAGFLENKYTSLEVCRKKVELMKIFHLENPRFFSFPSHLGKISFGDLLSYWPITDLKPKKTVCDQAVQVQSAEAHHASLGVRRSSWILPVSSQRLNSNNEVASRTPAGAPSFFAESLRDSYAQSENGSLQTRQISSASQAFFARGSLHSPQHRDFPRSDYSSRRASH